MSVLIADHDPQSRYLLRRALVGEWKLGITEVDNGVAALERIAETAYQLLILEEGLPLLDGLEVLEVIRAEPRTSKLPVVVTGKDVTEAKLRRIIELGVTDFVVKPFGVERLLSRLTRIVKQLVEADDERDPSREVKHVGLAAAERALVIEASAPFRQLLLTLLRKRVTAVGVAVGTQAVRAAVEQPPDVVFVGEDTGILHGTLLVSKLKSLPDCRGATFIAILPPDQELDAETRKLYQGTLRRTTREDLLEEGLVEVFRGQEVRTKLQEKLSHITKHVRKTAVEVFEILTGCEVRVEPVSNPESITGEMAAMDLPIVGTDTILRFGVRGATDSIRQLASWLGTEIPEDSPSGVADLLAESLNLVAGGLRNWLIDDGLEVRMNMPEERTPLPRTEIHPLEVTLTRDHASATLFIELTSS
ncbi:MAG: PleD family two-component system response regulator [Vicinamibacterales bacterium]